MTHYLVLQSNIDEEYISLRVSNNSNKKIKLIDTMNNKNENIKLIDID